MLLDNCIPQTNHVINNIKTIKITKNPMLKHWIFISNFLKPTPHQQTKNKTQQEKQLSGQSKKFRVV